ncbi:LIF receptor subunit alpha a [Chanos chanos]|uniref:LIF receptor subunit alpha a n=1 Tax=Chanos chanos TaxID=29144 RepID=A0A6J2WU91_CHACN|nr:leukemia inhibitory factor receptor-like [Chanos chanos]
MLRSLLGAVLLALRFGLCFCGSELAGPRSVAVQRDLARQTLQLTWESDSSVFDIEILHTELEDMVFNATVTVPADSSRGQHQWNWTSAVPLECTSHSVRLRAREDNRLSQWSPKQTLPGMDLPDQTQSKMFPQDRVVPVGSTLSFCCIVGEGKEFGSIHFKSQKMEVVRLSRRSYATTVTLHGPSGPTGDNVVCFSGPLLITGAVVFVGYPPGDEGLECETSDLTSAECHWSKGRDTKLRLKSALTSYTLNGRFCADASGRNAKNPLQCKWEHWQRNWTLVAQNPLGSVRLTDSADVNERVRPVAPWNLTAPVVKAWNASVEWNWAVAAYKTLPMICQVQLTGDGHTITRNVTGVGLAQAVLRDLRPDEAYGVKVRCAALNHFWKWGSWSSSHTLHTQMDRPETPDVWIWMKNERTAWVLWKPLSGRDSHGALLGYDVSVSDEGVKGWKTLSLPQHVQNTSVTLGNTTASITVSVTARNLIGSSPPARVVGPEYRADSDDAASELIGRGGGFDLAWAESGNASLGYVLEWFSTGCEADCHVEWLKIPEGETSAKVQSDSLNAGVRYTLSVYAVSEESSVLQHRSHGYTQEMTPAQPVRGLAANQLGSDVQLTWDPAAMVTHRGFLRGYTVYLSNASHLDLIANVTDSQATGYTVQALPVGSYKFVVKSYTSAGEGVGSTVAIKLDLDADMLVIEILISLAVMTFLIIFITIVCYKKRKWVMKAFYPNIPAPKVPGDWPTHQGTLDVKPSPPSMLQIVESPDWDSSKDGLVVIPEEDSDEAEGYGDQPVDGDSDEPPLLRYYNHVMDDPHPPDSSGSSTNSISSTQTDVTYTGVQTSSSSSCGADAAQPDIQLVAGGYRPQMQPCVVPDADPEPAPPGGFAGYKPQCSWRQDSPEEQSLSGSLGSPTSVTSSQFLLPDASEEEEQQQSNTWFHNFLSGKS